MSLNFEGIVTSNAGSPINPKGEMVRLIAILPERARDIPCADFAALQAAYNGELEIVSVGKRITAELPVMVCTVHGLRTHRRKLVNMIDTHLGIISTVQ